MVNVLNTSHHHLYRTGLAGIRKRVQTRVMQQVRKQHLHTIIKMKAFDSRVSLFYKVNNLLKISNRFPTDYHNNCPHGPVSRKQPVNCVIILGIKAIGELRSSFLFSASVAPGRDTVFME